jgi:hypothetical protein
MVFPIGQTPVKTLPPPREAPASFHNMGIPPFLLQYPINKAIIIQKSQKYKAIMKAKSQKYKAIMGVKSQKYKAMVPAPFG